jgi:hypothetical protein
MQHPVNGKFKMTAWPVRFSGSPPTGQAGTVAGQNNEDVLASGWTDRDDIGTLRRYLGRRRHRVPTPAAARSRPGGWRESAERPTP